MSRDEVKREAVSSWVTTSHYREVKFEHVQLKLPSFLPAGWYLSMSSHGKQRGSEAAILSVSGEIRNREHRGGQTVRQIGRGRIVCKSWRAEEETDGGPGGVISGVTVVLNSWSFTLVHSPHGWWTDLFTNWNICSLCSCLCSNLGISCGNS